MRPDQRWFPTNRVERAAWFANFTNAFEKIALVLGLTQADIDAVKADNAVVQHLAAAVQAQKTYARVLASFQRSILGGRKTPTVPNYPSPPVIVPPPMVANGIFERLERLVRRIRTLPGYTTAMGASLGIIPRNPSRKTPPDYVPKFKIKSATSPYSFIISTTKLHHSLWRVEVRREGETKWEIAGFYTSSPATVTLTPRNPGKPEMVQVRIRMIKSDKDVGEYSSIQNITLTPF